MLRCAALGLTLLCGCDGLHSSFDSGPTDSGPTDSGPTDSGPTDSGPTDSGPTDSGPADSGPIDSGTADSGPADSGVACDAGFHGCAGACFADDSTEKCGASCVQCGAPGNATAVCSAGACDFVCPYPQLRCGASCCKTVAVVAGYQHSCALSDLGTVRCWGSGMGVGDGTFLAERLTPFEVVVGGDAGVAQLAASLFNTCARLSSGALRCWGNNGNGSIGDGTSTPRPAAVEVFARGVSRVALGAFFGCAVVDAGARCWGSGVNGQLGDGAGANRSTPGPVSGLFFGVTGLWAGYNNACVSTGDGGFSCWGANGSGECGDGTKVHPRLTPVTVVAVDAGLRELQPMISTSCALTDVQGVRCFGGNAYGKLGDGTSGPRLFASYAVGLGSGVTQLTSNPAGEHYCAIQDGGALCWGLNDKGQLGDTTVINKNVPTPVFGLSSGVQWIATGDKHTCAATIQGGIKCWGNNNNGQLGDGTKLDRWIPTDVK